jgi:short-subunit dehydrogenase
MSTVYRRALITGASSGIGAAFAQALPPITELLLCGRRGDVLNGFAERLREGGARRIETLAADLAGEGGRNAVIEFGRSHVPDLLVCNAGVGVYGAFVSNSREREVETVEVNIAATVALLHGLLPEMIAAAGRDGQRAGVILMSSTAAFSAVPRHATYAASKAFLLRLAEALAAELCDEPVDILALCPPATATAFFERAGMPMPDHAIAPEVIAREGLSTLGKRTVHICGARNQSLALLIARNPIVRSAYDVVSRLRFRR